MWGSVRIVYRAREMLGPVSCVCISQFCVVFVVVMVASTRHADLQEGTNIQVKHVTK